MNSSAWHIIGHPEMLAQLHDLHCFSCLVLPNFLTFGMLFFEEMALDKNPFSYGYKRQNLSLLLKWKSNFPNSVLFGLLPLVGNPLCGCTNLLATEPSRIQTVSRVCSDQVCWVYDSWRDLKKRKLFNFSNGNTSIW